MCELYLVVIAVMILTPRIHIVLRYITFHVWYISEIVDQTCRKDLQNTQIPVLEIDTFFAKSPITSNKLSVDAACLISN